MSRSKILFIVGSVRKDSFNRQLSRIAYNMVAEWHDVDYLDPASVPYMNQDLEADVPESVKSAREAVMSSDAVWIFTPEYNRSIPGVLKNLLDWLSRPLDLNDPDRVSALTSKKVIITGVGGGKRTEFCRKALFDMLTFVGMEVLDGEGAGFSLDRRAFAEGIWEPDEDCINVLRKQADKLHSSLE